MDRQEWPGSVEKILGLGLFGSGGIEALSLSLSPSLSVLLACWWLRGTGPVSPTLSLSLSLSFSFAKAIAEREYTPSADCWGTSSALCRSPHGCQHSEYVRLQQTSGKVKGQQYSRRDKVLKVLAAWGCFPVGEGISLGRHVVQNSEDMIQGGA